MVSGAGLGWMTRLEALRVVLRVAVGNEQPYADHGRRHSSPLPPLSPLMAAHTPAHMASAHFGKLAADAPNLIAGGPAGIDISFWTRF